MKRYYPLDYIWYIGEALRRKYGNPSSGSLVVNFVWLFGILVPLMLPVMYRLFGNPAAIICGLALLFLPEIFLQTALYRTTPYRNNETLFRDEKSVQAIVCYLWRDIYICGCNIIPYV